MPSDVSRIRNVVVVGQGGVGKTMVSDALLFGAGVTTRLGRADDGSSSFDTEPEEQRDHLGKDHQSRDRKPEPDGQLDRAGSDHAGRR